MTPATQFVLSYTHSITSSYPSKNPYSVIHIWPYARTYEQFALRFDVLCLPHPFSESSSSQALCITGARPVHQACQLCYHAQARDNASAGSSAQQIICSAIGERLKPSGFKRLDDKVCLKRVEQSVLLAHEDQRGSCSGILQIFRSLRDGQKLTRVHDW